MINRISKILKEKNITSAKFADEIGVQRSSISHVLSGRNKPSLEFVQKIIKAYPEIDITWLLSGKGNIYIKENIQENVIDFPEDVSTEKEKSARSVETFEQKPGDKKRHTIDELTGNQSKSNHNLYKNKKIEKIVILYNDNTFKEYYPE